MFKKLPANAMYFAVLISAVVAVILSCFILLVYLSQKSENQAEIISQNIKKVKLSFDHYNLSETASENATATYWGSYGLLKVNSGNSSSFDFEKVGLMGFQLDPENEPVLYLQDKNMPLVLAGKSKLEGQLFIPGAYIKLGSINGEYFIGSKPDLSRIDKSELVLPELNPDWLRYLDSIFHSFPLAKDNHLQKVEMSNSFYKDRFWKFYDTEISLDEELTGNIIIKSSKLIRLESVAKLEDVLLIAPKVIVRSGFRGNIHIIAEEVGLEDNSFLKYPSSISILEKGENNINSQDFKLSIGSNTKVHGNIVILSNDNKEKKELFISESSEVIGGIYNQGYTDLQGNVYGELYTGGFAAHSNGSVYINHIFNGSIHESSRGVITGIPLKDRNEIVAKWMY